MLIQWIALAVLISWCVTAMMSLFVIRYRRPERAWAWLAVMFGLPWIGLLLYVLCGGQILTMRRRRQYSRGETASERARGRQSAYLRYERRPSLPDYLSSTDGQVEAVGEFVPTGGNVMSIEHEDEKIVRSIIDDIQQAENHVHMVFYIFSDDDVGRRVADALMEAAQRGVKCRVLLDSVGASPAFQRLVPEMETAGVEVRAAFPANPFRGKLKRFDLRNHRKIVIIDGQIAHVGSWNVCDASLPESPSKRRFDVMLRGVGPMALQAQTLFLIDWAFEGEEPTNHEELFPEIETAGEDIAQIVPSDPLVDSAPVRDTAHFLINHARERVVLVTPYFIPDEPVELALCMAARRGVDVNVVVPAHSDLRFVDAATRSYCRVCADAGVNTHFFTAGFLHAKMLLVDDAIAMVGSANFDNRSFRLNLETNVVVYSPSFINHVQEIQQYYLDQSVGMREAFGEHPRHRRLAEDLARLVSPLL